MRLSLLLITLLLSGCLGTIPAKPDWPTSPEIGRCPDLALVENGTEKLSETIKVITENYSEYNKCQGRVDTWEEWYKSQKRIYEDAK